MTDDEEGVEDPAMVVCECGHVYDEHDSMLCCTVEDCPCVYFDDAGSEE